MDAFDFRDDPRDRKKKTTTRGLILNLGAIYFLASTFCLIGFFIYTFITPNNPLNPFPPPTQPGELSTLAPTMPPSQTAIIIPTSTATLPPTNTASPTFTAAATNTATPTADTTELTITPTTGISIRFSAQTGTPVYAPHPNGCDGIYLVGNVIDDEGNPLIQMVVDAGGSLGGATIDPEPSTSGSHPEFSASGWQIKISDALVASSDSIYVALYPAGSDQPVSDLVFVDTYDDCEKNMIMVNFVQDE